MIARLLRLKLDLLRGAFRRSPVQLVGMIVGVVYAFGLTAAIVVSLIAARFADVDLVRDVVVTFGAAVTLGFLLLPLVFGVDDTMDPRKFALFGIEKRSLAIGLAAAGGVSIPAAALALSAAATIVTWAYSFWSVLFALVGAALAVITSVLAARVSTAAAAFLLDTRRARELTGVVGVLLLVLVGPVLLSLANVDWSASGLPAMRAIADIVRWTPMGAAWAAPADAAAGHPLTGFLELLIALATAALLWLAWEALVGRILIAPSRAVESRTYAGLGWFSALPKTRWGAIAARSLSYWGRDPRYWVSLVVIPVIPAIMLAALWVVHAFPLHYTALIPLPVMALFLGWSAHNDVAYDGTAVWMHVVSGRLGLADRIGRMVPVLMLGIPLIVVGTILTLVAYGDLRALPAVVGVSVVLLLTGLGMSSITSGLFPYPVARPGESPFQQPQGVNAVAAFVQAGSLVVILGLSAPAIVFGVLGLFSDPAWFTASLWAGLLVGVGACVGGIAFGGWIVDRRWPQILQAALRAA